MNTKMNGPKENIGKEPIQNSKPTEVINQPEEVQQSNDEKIDQDFPGFPHAPATKEIINGEKEEIVNNQNESDDNY